MCVRKKGGTISINRRMKNLMSHNGVKLLKLCRGQRDIDKELRQTHVCMNIQRIEIVNNLFIIYLFL